MQSLTVPRIGRLAALAERYVEGMQREEYYPSPGMACRWCRFRRQCKGGMGGE